MVLVGYTGASVSRFEGTFPTSLSRQEWSQPPPLGKRPIKKPGHTRSKGSQSDPLFTHGVLQRPTLTQRGLPFTPWAHEIFLLHHCALYLSIRPWQSLYTKRPLTWPLMVLHSGFLSGRTSCAGFSTPFWPLFSFGVGGLRLRNKPNPPRQILEHQNAPISWAGRLSYPGRLISLGPWWLGTSPGLGHLFGRSLATLIQQQSAPGFPHLFVDISPSICYKIFLVRRPGFYERQAEGYNPEEPTLNPPALRVADIKCCPSFLGINKFYNMSNISNTSCKGGSQGGEGERAREEYHLC